MTDNLFHRTSLAFHTNQTDTTTFFMVKTDNHDLKNLDNFSDLEKEKLSEYRYEKRRNEWIAGRIAAKNTIQQSLQCQLQLSEIEIHNRDDGRPCFKLPVIPCKEIDISISHSRKYGVAMTAPSACGVDIQQTEATLTRVENRFCTEKELELFNRSTQAPKEVLLTKIWAAKEAVKKAASISGTMLGFLELQLTDIEQQGDIYQYTLLATKQIKNMPTIYQANVSYFEEYAVASCVMPEITQAIWERRNA